MTKLHEDHDLRDALSRQHHHAVPNNLCSICLQTVDNSVFIQQALGNCHQDSNDGASRPSPAFEEFMYQENFEALYKSAYGGCHLCSLIFACASTEAISNTSSVNFRLKLQHSVHRNDLVVRRKPLFDLQVTSRPSELYAALEDDIWEEGQYTQRDVGAVPLCWTTAGEGALTLARAWIAQCLSSHLPRNQQAIDHVLPTRLLYISDDPTSIRLILSQDAPKDLEYTTLSY